MCEVAMNSIMLRTMCEQNKQTDIIGKNVKNWGTAFSIVI